MEGVSVKIIVIKLIVIIAVWLTLTVLDIKYKTILHPSIYVLIGLFLGWVIWRLTWKEGV